MNTNQDMDNAARVDRFPISVVELPRRRQKDLSDAGKKLSATEARVKFRLTTSELQKIPHKSISKGGGRPKRLYKVEDILAFQSKKQKRPVLGERNSSMEGSNPTKSAKKRKHGPEKFGVRAAAVKKLRSTMLDQALNKLAIPDEGEQNGWSLEVPMYDPETLFDLACFSPQERTADTEVLAKVVQSTDFFNCTVEEMRLITFDSTRLTVSDEITIQYNATAMEMTILGSTVVEYVI